MNVYLDQNFLIRCRESFEESEKLVAAQRSGKVTLVLSPIHFYEAGTVREEHFQRTLDLLEMVKPAWCLSRADMQLHEFRREWNHFWRQPEIAFDPIGDIAHVLSAMHGKPREAFEGVLLKQAIAPFRAASTAEIFDPVFEMNRKANSTNRERFLNGQLTPMVWKIIERTAIALQLARESEREPSFERTSMKIERILDDPTNFAKISIFIENGGSKKLRAHTVEILMTQDRLVQGGDLGENPQVDRDHSVVALASCELFVTYDRKLRNLCNRISRTLRSNLQELALQRNSLQSFVELRSTSGETLTSHAPAIDTFVMLSSAQHRIEVMAMCTCWACGSIRVGTERRMR